MHFRSRTKRLASLDLFLNDFKITLGGEGNVFLKSPRYVSGSTRNGEFVDNQRGFPGVIFGFPVPAFLNRGRFLIGAPVPMDKTSMGGLRVYGKLLIAGDAPYDSPLHLAVNAFFEAR